MSDILSQEEIDALLSAYSTGAATANLRASERSTSHEVRLYDFARPERFSKDEVRQLEAVHKTFASRFSTHLSALLRSTVDIQHTTLDQASFDEYLKSVPSPTLISTFRLDPVGVRCIIEFNPNVVFALVDLMAGGDGDAYMQARELSEIEIKLMEGVLRSGLGHYVSAWDQVAKINCHLERVGSNPMVNPVGTAQDQMMSSYFEIRVAKQVGLISICMPIAAVEDIFDVFGPRTGTAAAEPDSTLRDAIEGNLRSTKVLASVILGRAPATIRDLLDLRKGDFVRLDQGVKREIAISVHGIPKFYGIPGIVGRKLGVHITRDFENDGGPGKEHS